MNEFLKRLRGSNRSIDKILSGKYDAKKLEFFKTLYRISRAQERGIGTYLGAQRILRRQKTDGKQFALLESIVGPLVDKADLDAIREARNQMREKLVLLKAKIGKMKG